MGQKNIIDASANATGAAVRYDNTQGREYVTVQTSNMAGTAGKMVGDNAITDPLTEAGDLVFDIQTPDEGLKRITVTFAGTENEAAMLAAINAALGTHGTATVAATKLTITNDEVGGSFSTVQYVSASSDALGGELGTEDGAGTVQTTETPGTDATFSMAINGRVNPNAPWALLATHTDTKGEMLASFPEYQAVLSSYTPGQGVIRVDIAE